MRTLHIIGAGRVGRTLGRLWAEQAVFTIDAVAARSAASAESAVRFVGAGRPCTDLSALPPADVVLITTGDAAIEPCCEALVAAGAVQAGTIVFHCSGAKSSTVLRSARARGAFVASTHPLKSFAEPRTAARSFAGTPCGCEGDTPALALLEPALAQIGGKTFRIATEAKASYHCAAVLVSNCLTALVDSALRVYATAGIDDPTARGLIAPLAREALEHALRLPAHEALTGPIARGDDAVVAEHLRQLGSLGLEVEERIYRALGERAVEIARRQGRADPEDLERIARRLEPHGSDR